MALSGPDVFNGIKWNKNIMWQVRLLNFYRFICNFNLFDQIYTKKQSPFISEDHVGVQLCPTVPNHSFRQVLNKL